ncbi:MAG: crotonase/enoyl-CoA hydratase family protein [Pseudomonadota bacterium]
MSDLVEITKDNGVAHVELNRGEKYNALSQKMFAAIVEAGQSLMHDESTRAVVLSGRGKGFCAGLDFSSFQAMGNSDGNTPIDTGRQENIANRGQMVGYVWKQLPMPVIAGIHGVAFGGGFQLSLGADIRIAAPDARFSVMEIKWGLIPDMSITQTFRELVRMDVAKELTFTGRVFDAPEAAELGIVTQVKDDPIQAALDMAQEIASKSPTAIRAGKKLFEETWRSEPAHGFQLEESLQLGLIGSPNQVEAVKSNFENRPANYKDIA